MLRVIIFECENPYHSTSLFAASLCSALKMEGADARILSFKEGYEGESLREVFYDPPDLTCSFSDITFGGLPLGEAWKIPHLSFLIDPFPYFLHQAKGPFSYVSTADLEDLEHLQKMGCEKAFFLPHATPLDLASSEISSERSFDIVFFGTAIDPEEVLNQSPNKNTLRQAAELVLAPEGLSCFNALIECKAFSYEPGFFELFRELDLYIRAKDRLELIRSLQGLNIAVFGDKIGSKGWKELLLGQLGVQTSPAISFGETIEVMKRAKIVLNSSPRLRHGSHERIFYGLGAGALVATGGSRFIDANFSKEKELLTYEYGKWGELKEKIIDLFANPHKAEEMQYEGRKRVLNHHTYNNRASSLLHYFK